MKAKKGAMILLLALGFQISLKAGNEKISSVDSMSCLLVAGNFSDAMGFVTKIKVYLYQDNAKIDSATVDSHRDFAFVLKRNKKYSVEVSKKGFYTRYITIDTKLSDDVSAVPLFVFEFTLELKKEMKGVDDYYLDFPIAHINYSDKYRRFDYSRKYTTMMREQIKKAEGEFKMVKSR